MGTIRLPLLVLLGLLPWLVGYRPGTLTRTIVSVTGQVETRKLSSRTITQVFAGLEDFLQARGFSGGNHKQPSAYHLPFDPICSDGYWLEPGLGCTAYLDRRDLKVRFYENESPRGSGRFTATQEQRALALTFARELEAHVRRQLPTGFHLDRSEHGDP